MYQLLKVWVTMFVYQRLKVWVTMFVYQRLKPVLNWANVSSRT